MQRSALYVLAVFLINGFVAFFTINIIVATLPADRYLQYSSLVSAAALVSAVFFQWLRVYALRELVSDFDKSIGSFLVKLKVTTTLFMLLAFIFLGVSAFFIDDDIFAYYAVLVVVFGQGLYEVSLGIWRSGECLKEFFIYSLLRALTWLGFVLLSWYFKLSVYDFLCFMSVSFLLGAFFAYHKFGQKPIVLSLEVPRIKLSSGYLFNVSFTVVLGFLSIYLFKVFCVAEASAAGTILAWFDLLYLICITPFLAANYVYQTKMVKRYSDGQSFGKYSIYLLFSFLVSALAVFVVYQLSYFSLASFSLIDIDMLIPMASAIMLVAIKQNWLDHAYYLQRKFFSQMLSLVVAILITLAYWFFSPVSDFSGAIMVYAVTLVTYAFITERLFLMRNMAGYFIFLLCVLIAVPGGFYAGVY
jgi:hypothetical protein